MLDGRIDEPYPVEAKRQRTAATGESACAEPASAAVTASATAASSTLLSSIEANSDDDDDDDDDESEGEEEDESEEGEGDEKVTDFASLVDAVRTSSITHLKGPWGDMSHLALDLPTKAQAEQLADALELNTSLTKISITDTEGVGGINDDVWTALFAAIGRGALPNLKYLNLECNEFNDTAAAALAACVHAGGLANLQHLQLNHNPMGDAGAIAIAGCASAGGFPELKELNMSNNGVNFGRKTTRDTFTACVSAGCFPKLGRMYINDEPWPSALEEACKARKIVLRHY